VIVDLQNALQVWKHMRTSFLDLVKYGTAAMVREALAAGQPDPNTPSSHASEQVHPITEAVRRGDTEILRAMLESGRVELMVVDFVCSGGCGIGTVYHASPLAVAILARSSEMTLMIADTHPDIEADAGYSVKSTFEGDTEKTILQLVAEWGNADIMAKVKKIAAKKT
jgi:hypothetical protein